jgi:hypothetical protein
MYIRFLWVVETYTVIILVVPTFVAATRAVVQAWAR